MKKFRFYLALILVLTMVLSTPLMVMAKEWDAYVSDDVVYAFDNDTDAEVIINMKNDINMDQGLTANEGQNYTINGNGNTISNVNIYGKGSVEVNADVTVEEDWTALQVGGDASVTVNGDVEGLGARENAKVVVNGDVNGVDGNPDDVDYSDPLGFSDGGDGVNANDKAEITVNGNVTGGDAYGTYGYAGDGVDADDEAKVTVTGNVTGGSVTADPEVEADFDEINEDIYYNSSQAGDGVEVNDNASVTVGGNVTGGSTNGDQGFGGYGVVADGEAYYDENDDLVIETPSVTVGGDVTGGNATNGYGGDAVSASDMTEVSVEGNATGGAATTGAAGVGIYATNDVTVSVGGDVTGGTASDGESGVGIYAIAYGSYREGNEEGIEQGTVTVEGTVSGGEGAASIYFNAPEGLDEFLEEIMDLDLDAALKKDPADLTEKDLMALDIAVMIMMENGDLTEEEVLAYEEEAEDFDEEEAIAFIQNVIKKEMTQEIDIQAELLEPMGLNYSLITVGAVSKENGPAYGSNAGEEFAQKMAQIHVTEVGLATPNTGDGFNPMMVLAVALVSLMGVCALVVFKKKAA